ncbi:hypothetical protein BD289DRAFT_98155 [Coniella lustricola]|uniref:Uncharacterized protein n=1 Tax=Coniella lustricola TaxID=2025994 RepID=A0A2T3AN70_9PEZI|nr:hypothetical protein BD289DRAFT_98155 [Coniella lustricola]
MGSHAIVGLRKPGRSRLSKALPTPPPPGMDRTDDAHQRLELPVRRDSLRARPALPPKDIAITGARNRSSSASSASTSNTKNTALRIPTSMAARTMDSPLPPLPQLPPLPPLASLSKGLNHAPTTIPKRKPVATDFTAKNPPILITKAPPPPPQLLSRSGNGNASAIVGTARNTGRGDISPAESLSSLLSSYATEDSLTDNRYSQDTAATKHSFMEPSSPKVLPKDSLGAATMKPEIVSPFFLPNPVASSSSDNTNTVNGSHPLAQSKLQFQSQSRQMPQTDSWHSRTTQRQDRPPTPPEKNNQRPITPKSSKSALPTPPATDNISLAGQSPPQPQIWKRRKSLKAVKPLAVPDLKMAASDSSTASSTQPMSSGRSYCPPSSSQPDGLRGAISPDSPILNNSKGNYSAPTVGPVNSQRSVPHGALPRKMGHKHSRETLDGFSAYAQELEQGMANGTYEAPQYSPAAMSPASDGPPTPEYEDKQEPASGVHASYTQPSNLALATPPNDARPLSMIPEMPDVPVERNVVTAGAIAPPPAGPLPSLPQRSTSRPGSSSAAEHATAPAFGPGPATVLAPSPEIRSVSPSPSAAAAPKPSIRAVPSIEVSGEEDEPQYLDTHPGEPNHFPLRYCKLPEVERGTVLSAAPLKTSQLNCMAGHYQFLPSRNQFHPIACQTCGIRDNETRWSCGHCAVRICIDCKEVLSMNGKDLPALVQMLKS